MQTQTWPEAPVPTTGMYVHTQPIHCDLITQPKSYVLPTKILYMRAGNLSVALLTKLMNRPSNTDLLPSTHLSSSLSGLLYTRL